MTSNRSNSFLRTLYLAASCTGDCSFDCYQSKSNEFVGRLQNFPQRKIGVSKFLFLLSSQQLPRAHRCYFSDSIGLTFRILGKDFGHFGNRSEKPEIHCSSALAGIRGQFSKCMVKSRTAQISSSNIYIIYSYLYKQVHFADKYLEYKLYHNYIYLL